LCSKKESHRLLKSKMQKKPAIQLQSNSGRANSSQMKKILFYKTENLVRIYHLRQILEKDLCSSNKINSKRSLPCNLHRFRPRAHLKVDLRKTFCQWLVELRIFRFPKGSNIIISWFFQIRLRWIILHSHRIFIRSVIFLIKMGLQMLRNHQTNLLAT